MEILSPAAKDIITDEQVRQAQAAASSGDKHLAGKVLGDIWKQVAENPQDWDWNGSTPTPSAKNSDG